MKIRVGFVSNSSSASFILHTDFKMEEFILLLQKNMPEVFNKEAFKKVVSEDIEKTKERVIKEKEELKKDPNAMSKIWLGQDEDRLKYLKNILKSLDNPKINLIETIFIYNGNRLEVNQMEKACVCGWTTMWNDEEDMGELLIKIRNMLTNKYGHNKWMLDVSCDG